VRGRCRHVVTTAADFASCHDELRGEPVASEVAGSLGVIDSDGEVLMNLKVQVRRIHPVIVSDRSYLLATADLLAFSDSNSVHVGVE